ncbi:hypothetical protein [Skermanella mucosa]|uniref:hypothetical protein n=1 Tax=Skermanella mucosa TaxID=1789672 RepID=UPI00389A320A
MAGGDGNDIIDGGEGAGFDPLARLRQEASGTSLEPGRRSRDPVRRPARLRVRCGQFLHCVTAPATAWSETRSSNRASSKAKMTRVPDGTPRTAPRPPEVWH